MVVVVQEVRRKKTEENFLFEQGYFEVGLEIDVGPEYVIGFGYLVGPGYFVE